MEFLEVTDVGRVVGGGESRERRVEPGLYFGDENKVI